MLVNLSKIVAYIKKLLNQNNLALLLILSFFLIRLPYFLSDAFLPDELWHTSYVRYLSLRTFNIYQGFGGGFWVLLHAFMWIFGSKKIALFALRGVSLTSICLSAYFIYKMYRQNNVSNSFSLLLLLCYLTLPMLFFGGKLITPEFYSLFFITFSAYLVFDHNNKSKVFPWIMLGFTAGMKLTSAPPVIMIYLLKVLSDWRCRDKLFNANFYKMSAKYILLIIIGFLICCPSLIYDYSGFIKNMSGNGSYNLTSEASIPHLARAMFTDSIAWDLVSTSSINENVMSIVTFIILSLIILLNTSFGVFIVYLLSVMSFLLMLSINSIFYIWHSFQSVLVIFLPFAYLKNTQQNKLTSIVLYSFLVLTILTNLFYTAIIYNRDVTSRKMMSDTLSYSRPLYRDCLFNSLSGLSSSVYKKVNMIINRSEIGANSERQELLYYKDLEENVKWIKNIEVSISPSAEDIAQEFLKGNLILVLSTQRAKLFVKNMDYAGQRDIQNAKDYMMNKYQQDANINATKLYQCGVIDIFLLENGSKNDK